MPRGEPMPRSAARCRARAMPRSEPMMPRAAAPGRAAEGAAVRAAERAAAPPPPTAAAPPPPALPARTRISPRWRSGWKPRCAGRPARRADGRRRSRPSRRRPRPRRAASPRSAPPAPPAPPPKTGFENLEDEMASLLGRPKTRLREIARQSRVEFYSSCHPDCRRIAGRSGARAGHQHQSRRRQWRRHRARDPADRAVDGAVDRAVDPGHDDVVHPDRGGAVAAAHRARHRDRAAELRHHRAGDVPDRLRDGAGAAEIL